MIFSTGHGPAIIENSLDKIDEYISHRGRREEEILAVLQKVFLQNKFQDKNYGNCSVNTRISSCPAPEISETQKFMNSIAHTVTTISEFGNRNKDYKSSWEIMLKVYGKLPLFVQFSAQSNCLHHLDKLLKEKKVSRIWPDLWTINTV